MQAIAEPARELADALARVGGVVGVVLGGSRARGREHPDSDVDLGLYYEQGFDWPGAVEVLRAHDDARRPRGLAPPGAWGPWMNGGAWLRVGGGAVDVLLRDASFVEQIARDAQEGSFSSNYLPGFPHGWHSFMLLGEVFFNVPLTGDLARLRALRDAVDPYPEALRASIIDRFLYEARFSSILLSKLTRRDEVALSAGLAYRTAMCMVHTIFALNRTYLVNEKGAVAVAAGFEQVPPVFSARIDEALGPCEGAHRNAVLASLVDEVEALVRENMALTTSWDASSFPAV